VIVRRELVDASVELDALRQRFDLSLQEARIALALRDGGTVAEIALRLGMAYETARVHLKSAFAKTDTHRQRELLALVLDTTGPRGGAELRMAVPAFGGGAIRLSAAESGPRAPWAPRTGSRGRP
jgi:DNA-binding CsgD family transcriptional regulator